MEDWYYKYGVHIHSPRSFTLSKPSKAEYNQDIFKLGSKGASHDKLLLQPVLQNNPPLTE